MTTLTHHTTSPHDRRDSRRRAGTDLLAGLPALLAVALVTRAVFDLPASYLLQALACYAATAALVFSTVPGTLPGPGLGPANRVTLARATVLLPVAALVWQPGIHHANGYWWIIAVSTVAMITDGLDGWTARRSGTATSFGARFDMELDALLMLALALLVALSGKVGPWVVSIGVLRYLFVIAGWLWPTLKAELPPSTRRQTVCVVQGVVLLVCLGPIVPAALAATGATAALALLIYSFAVDVRWLVVH